MTNPISQIIGDMMNIYGIEQQDKTFFIIMIILCSLLFYVITFALFGDRIERNNDKIKNDNLAEKVVFHPFASLKALCVIALPFLFGKDMAVWITTKRRFWIESFTTWFSSHITLIVVITVAIIAVLVGTVLFIRKKQQYNSNQNHNQTN